ncbi:MAG: thermonuclease family protein [Rickettsiales bacterium]|jgi:endonuclease YncB( thermonuclease family)|nr:thermonuclease family protein [Rickettsiales bacterium]
MLKSNKYTKSILFITLVVTITYKFFIKPNPVISSQSQPNKVNLKLYGYAKIIDGDSIVIDNHEIRIREIDAPELYQICQNQKLKEYPCGKQSKSYLQKITKNKKVQCTSYAKDIYNRYLATCYIENVDIAISMLEQGWAVIYRLPSPLYKYQENARINKLGVWQGEFTYPQIWRKLHRRK